MHLIYTINHIADGSQAPTKVLSMQGSQQSPPHPNASEACIPLLEKMIHQYAPAQLEEVADAPPPTLVDTLRDVLQNLNNLVGALEHPVDQGAQTGYPRIGRKLERARQSPTMCTIINRLRWGLPLMRYTRKDPAMR